MKTPAIPDFTAFVRPDPAYAALVRGEDGNLHHRRFATAAEAAAASSHRELPDARQLNVIMGQRGGEVRHTAFARKLGLQPRQVRDVFKRGGLPGAKEHSAYILVIPAGLLRLAEAYGLRTVERWAKAGLL